MNVGVRDKNDAIIRREGMNLLIKNLGKVDAERFISLIIREPFDYTEWQADLFEEMSLEELEEKRWIFINLIMEIPKVYGCMGRIPISKAIENKRVWRLALVLTSTLTSISIDIFL